jgi:hypothetical protein
MFNDCKVCKHFNACYPKEDYIETQLNAEIKRDLCVNNDKNDWEKVEA